MSLFVTASIAIRALRRNTMRTALTGLGLIIGVAAVIVMIAIGSGAQASIEAQIRTAGSHLIVVTAGSGGFGPVRQGQGATTTLTRDDSLVFLAGIRHLSPGVATRAQVVTESGNWNTQIQGAGEELSALRSWPLQFGEFFQAADVGRAARVAVLGSVVRDQLFGPGTDPTGAIVRIRNQPFRVLGVLTRKGQAAMGQDQDDTIVVPYTTVQKRLLGISHLQNVTISAESAGQLERLAAETAALVRIRHKIQPGDDDDFMVRTLEEMASVLTSTTTTMRWLLAAVAAVSLIVGGIGIMNIMLVSVTERTKEIGLRLSVGARDVDVLLQFLVEAIVLSVAGGAIGVLLGTAASWTVGRVMGWSAPVTFDAIALSFAFAAGVGVFFGFYPARKAAGLNPIDALRYE